MPTQIQIYKFEHLIIITLVLTASFITLIDLFLFYLPCLFSVLA